VRHAWVDATAGVAGDMLLGALLDAGADLTAVRTAVRSVVGDAVEIEVREVTRAGLRATKADVRLIQADPPHRTWSTVQTMITDAPGLPDRVRERALAVFTRLAEAEGRVHGIAAAEVHFHEVGALDSIADVVGVCAALVSLGVDRVTSSEVALGSGTVRAAHGTIPVPVPAVVELSRGWPVLSGGAGELTTPTGMALVTTLAEDTGPMPPLVVERSGAGAGSKDRPERANITRVIIGTPATSLHAKLSTDRGLEAAETPQLSTVSERESAAVLEANVDDLDPRLWPEVLARLMATGASDAWLTPILMKKGRPAHTLSVLCPPEDADRLQEVVLTETSTLGVRRSEWSKYALERYWLEVDLPGGQVRIKIGHRGGAIVQATPEFSDIVALGAATNRAPQLILALAQAAAVERGLVAGAPYVPAPPPPEAGGQS
jgi:uncharacterized protein (TIGR00299 family) protein